MSHELEVKTQLNHNGCLFYADSAGAVYEWCGGSSAWLHYTRLCERTLRAAVIAELSRQEFVFNRDHMNRYTRSY